MTLATPTDALIRTYFIACAKLRDRLFGAPLTHYTALLALQNLARRNDAPPPIRAAAQRALEDDKWRLVNAAIG